MLDSEQAEAFVKAAEAAAEWWAARLKAGFDPQESRWPWKTVMWVLAGRVTVSAGYGAADEHVYLTVDGARGLLAAARAHEAYCRTPESGRYTTAEGKAQFLREAVARREAAEAKLRELQARERGEVGDA